MQVAKIGLHHFTIKFWRWSYACGVGEQVRPLKTVRVIVRAHDVDVSVHPALAGGEDPMLSKGLRKGLIPVLRRAMLGGRGLLAADTRAAPVKTLSLHEYKARLDQMDE